MAERQEIQEPDGMEDTLILAILRNLAFQRIEIGKDVPVGDDHPARLSRRARGENDFNNVIAGQSWRSDGICRVPGHALAQSFKREQWHAGDVVFVAAEAKPGVNLLSHALRKVGSGDLVDGDNNRPAQQTAKERGNPFRAVLAPQQDLVAAANSPRLQLAGKTRRGRDNFAVAPMLHAITAPMNIGGFGGVPAKVVQVLQYGGARHSTAV